MTAKRNDDSDRKASGANALWGGRFATGPAAAMAEINASIEFDRRLYAEDIAGSKAHAAMLVRQKILSPEDGEAIVRGLDAILEEIERDEFPFSVEHEDIHMNIEARLADLIGPVAGRLHTARSRNDQVATDFRLWVRNAAAALESQLLELQAALLERAEQEAATVMPGFTHLQPAQPITFGHHLLAYVEMFGRDRGRFDDCARRLNECPLGAAALAGTSFPIDREMTARELGFERPMANSLDAVSARDFAIEFLSAAAITITNLSRLAEEITIWSGPGFGFITLSDAYSTGSSIMPQKRNPDAAELVRGKSGRVIGALVNLITVIKGLALAYAKDLQEDKEPVFDAADTLSVCLATMTGMIRDFSVNYENMKTMAGVGFATATDLADWLVRTLDIPFREAHHITGRVVALAAERKCSLQDLGLEELQGIEPRIGKEVFDVLTVERSVASRTSYGGTAPDNVRAAVRAARERFL